MRKLIFGMWAVGLVPFGAFAVDGTVLINQSTVNAAGGFPYKITQPGSYRLSGNLVSSTNATVIDVSVDNVTIDLNGFAIIGPGTGVGGGIVSESGVNNVTVMNGTVRDFRIAIFLQGDMNVVDRVKAISNGNTGIQINGEANIVTNNVASLNGNTGIFARGAVIGNVAIHNGNYGLLIGGMVTNNRADFNRVGIGATSLSAVSNNVASGNSSSGIAADCPSGILGNTAFSNPGGNIFTSGSGCVLVNNAAP